MRLTTRSLAAFVITAGFLGLAPAQAADTYTLDAVHSTFMFKVKHLGASYSYGRFNESSGTFTLDTDNPANNSIEVEVKTESVDTANDARDKHLRSPDFFNAVEFPTLTFKSTSFKKVDDTHFEVTGDLTLHGVTKSITTTAELVGIGEGMKGEVRAGLEAIFTIDRTEFGMDYMPGPVGTDVEITVSVEGVRE
jgi:polyisoprenoid-binding protein YceI